MAPLKVGDKLPEGTLVYFDESDNKQTIDVHKFGAGKKIVIVGVPGAFTPTCSLKHLPGFIAKAGELKSLGVEEIVCLSVNDPFVMKEWSKTFPDNNKGDARVVFAADGSGTYAKALGFEVDLSDHGLGLRARRFSLVAEDLVVKILHLEEGGAFESSGAEDLVKELSV
eukprot:jgi/Mesen1/2826/ME001732S01987